MDYIKPISLTSLFDLNTKQSIIITEKVIKKGYRFQYQCFNIKPKFPCKQRLKITT